MYMMIRAIRDSRKKQYYFFLKLKEGYPGWPKSRGILPRITLEIKTILRFQV